MNERCGGKRAVWNKKLVSSTSKQASGRANGPALYASISCHFYPKCSSGGLAVIVAAVHGGIKLYEIDAFITKTKTASSSVISTRLFHRQKPLPKSSGARKQASSQMTAVEHASKASSAEQANE